MSLTKLPSTMMLDISAASFIQTGAGAVSRTLQSKLGESVSVLDFGAVGDGVTDDTVAFNAAIDKIGANGGGELKVPAGVYKITSKINKAVSNISIIGDGMPWYNNTNTALVGGTVIQGTVQLIGNNISIQFLGIDCGINVCNSINSGAQMNALVLSDPARQTHYNCLVRDVVTLCKEPASACHNFLLEGLSDSRFENLHARFAQWGVVLKTQRSTADGIYAYACSQAGLTIKSDTGINGAPANFTTVSNVVVNNDDYPSAANGVLIYAATEDLYSCALSNFVIKNGLVGLKLLGDARTSYVNVLNNISITNGVIEYCGTFGIESYGAISNAVISNIVLRDTVSNKSIKVWSDCLGISFNNVTASAISSFDALNVDLAGRFNFNDLISIVGGDINTPSGINIAPEARALMNIGNYRGTLYSSGTLAAVTLANGWTTYFSTVEIDARSNKAILRGRVQVPATPWTGKEQIATIPSNLAPSQTKWFMANGWNSATSATVPIYIEISVGGSITANFLNTVAAFPATILWLSLDGIQWSLNE